MNFILAFGFFNLFMLIIVKLIEKTTLIKKIILGPSYIGGTWIGYYINEGTPYVKYMLIKQNILTTRIKGYAYTIEKKERCHWTSEGNPTIDTEKDSLYFLYDVEVFGEESKYNGLIYFNLKEKKRFENPTYMTGHCFNLCSKIKMETKIIKISESSTEDSEQELIQKAIEFYCRSIKK